MSEPRYKLGEVLPNGVTITAELLEAVATLEKVSAAEIDDPQFAAELRRGAEEHMRILKDSRACRCYTEDGVRLTGAHCPMHTVFR